MINLFNPTKLIISISQFIILFKFKSIISVCNYIGQLSLKFYITLVFHHYNPQDFNPKTFEESSQSEQEVELSEVELLNYFDSTNSNGNQQNTQEQSSFDNKPNSIKSDSDSKTKNSKSGTQSSEGERDSDEGYLGDDEKGYESDSPECP